MSILITDMDMPHQGEFSHVRIYDNGEVTVEVDTGKDVYEAVIAHAVQLPPHGRLIDADALMLHIQDYIEEYDDDLSDNGYHSGKWCAMKETEMVINDAPTIIEAEGEE